MAASEQLITENLAIWSSAIQMKSAAGRGKNNKLEPYGIKKLRELILELAVRGLLVRQDPTDEPASELLKKMAAEKARLVKDGEIRKQKALPSIGGDEKPFEVPHGWEWVRLGEVGFTQTGGTPKKADAHHYGRFMPFIKPGDLNDGKILSYGNDGLSEEGAKSLARVAPEDSLLMVCIGTIGKCARVDRAVAFNQQINSVTPYWKIGDYIIKALQAAYFQVFAWDASSSTTLSILNKGKWEKIPVPLAPIEEQKRIVAKVDKLMALCDQLEQQQETSITAHQTLVQTLLDALTTASERGGFTAAWTRIADHFDTLFTTEWSIDQLKQTILQLAVMGKLVPQDPNDEPASELLKKIATEKARLVKDAKIKKQKILPPIEDDEKSFDVPNGWAFARMQDLCSLITDGTHQTPTYSEAGRPFISAQCVKPFRFMPENSRYVSEEDYQGYIKNRKPKYGDILLARVGAGIGEAAIIDTHLEFAIYVSTGLLKPHRRHLLSEYLAIWLNSPIGRRHSESNTLGKGVSQGNLNLSLIRIFVVSCPPLKEQHRIVAKVDELMALCDRLKSQVNATQNIKVHLADAITASAAG